MNRRIQVRRRKDIPVAAVYEGAGPETNLDTVTPDYFTSRIWMGIVPPSEGDPGYAAVLGEIYDPSLQQRERMVRLMDEGVALVPGDFSGPEKKYFDIPEGCNIRPTKKRLGQAIIGLKDIYWPSLVLVPPGIGSTERSDIRSASFTEFVRRLDGLVSYDNALGPRYFRRWWPFYRSNYRLVDGVVEVPNEDISYNKALIDSMAEANKLEVAKHCTVYLEEKRPMTRRCVGMVLAEMEMHDLTYELREWKFGDGYAEPNDDPAMEEEVDLQVASSREVWRWWGGETPLDQGGEPIDWNEGVM